MKNLLFIAYYFPPYGGPAVQRPAKFAKYLPEFGYRPLVLTAEGHRKKYSTDLSLQRDLGGISVTSCRDGEGRLRSMGLGPLAKLFLMPDKQILWVPGATRAALRLAEQHRIDAIFTTVAPRSCAVLGARLRKLLGVPWVLDYRDPWTTGDRMWPTPLHHWYDVRQERLALQAADAVVVVTPTMKDLLVQKFPEAKGKVHVIHNGFDREDFDRLTGEAAGDQFHIAYSGALYNYKWVPALLGTCLAKLVYRRPPRDWSTHSPRYLLQAIRALLDERPEWRDQVRVSFAGNFGKANARYVQHLGLQRVVAVKGYLPHDDSVRLLMQSDLLFLPMVSTPNQPRNYNLSGKVFEYLASGKPILAAVPEGDASDLVRRARAGWCVDPHDVGAMKNLLCELVERKRSGTYGIEPDQSFVNQFQRRELTGQLAALLDSLGSSAVRPAGRTPRRALVENAR